MTVRKCSAHCPQNYAKICTFARCYANPLTDRNDNKHENRRNYHHSDSHSRQSFVQSGHTARAVANTENKERVRRPPDTRRLSTSTHIPQKPEETAQEIGEWLAANCEAVEKFNVVKGFLNLTISPDSWIYLLNDIHADTRFGLTPPTEQSPLVMIEYSSPNTNKPLHLGHVRNNLLGFALANIIEANGNRVVKTNIVNDRGIHICKSMLAWLKYGHGETPETSGKRATTSSATITSPLTSTTANRWPNSAGNMKAKV